MQVELRLFLPQILLAVLAISVLIADLFFWRGKNKNLAFLSLFGLGAIAVVVLMLFGTEGRTFGGLFVIDRYASFFQLLFVIVGFMITLLSIDYFTKEDINNPGEYYALLIFAVLGMTLIVSTTDLIMIYMSLELTSVSCYVLAGYRRTDPKSNEASLKYFLVGLFASAMMLYGISFIYGFTGFTQLTDIARAINLRTGQLAIAMGIMFTLSGFCFKMAAVPFHQWAPDTYEGAPTPITAFFSIGPKAAAIAALIRVLFYGFPVFVAYWRVLFIVLSIASMFVGNLMAIPQTNIKRMLAYSSIAHAGYILLGLSVASKLAITAVLIYLAVYLFMNVGAFSVISSLSFGSPDFSDKIEDFSGLSKRSPFLAMAMAIFMLSLAGLPPLAGLWGKFFVFAAAMQENLLWLALIGLINSVISIYYYANVVRHMYLLDPIQPEPVTLSPYLLGIVWVALIGVIVLGVFPQPLISLSKASAVFGGGF